MIAICFFWQQDSSNWKHALHQISLPHIRINVPSEETYQTGNLQTNFYFKFFGFPVIPFAGSDANKRKNDCPDETERPTETGGDL